MDFFDKIEEYETKVNKHINFFYYLKKAILSNARPPKRIHENLNRLRRLFKKRKKPNVHFKHKQTHVGNCRRNERFCIPSLKINPNSMHNTR